MDPLDSAQDLIVEEIMEEIMEIKLRSPQEFLNVGEFNVPKSQKAAQERVIENLPYYALNYVIIGFIILVLIMFFRPWLILIVLFTAGCIGFLYSKKETHNDFYLFIFGLTAVLVAILFSVYIGGLLAIFSIMAFFLLVAFHASLRQEIIKPKRNELQQTADKVSKFADLVGLDSLSEHIDTHGDNILSGKLGSTFSALHSHITGDDDEEKDPNAPKKEKSAFDHLSSFGNAVSSIHEKITGDSDDEGETSKSMPKEGEQQEEEEEEKKDKFSFSSISSGLSSIHEKIKGDSDDEEKDIDKEEKEVEEEEEEEEKKDKFSFSSFSSGLSSIHEKIKGDSDDEEKEETISGKGVEADEEDSPLDRLSAFGDSVISRPNAAKEKLGDIGSKFGFSF